LYSILIEFLFTAVFIIIKFKHLYFPKVAGDLLFFANVIGLGWIILISVFFIFSKLFKTTNSLQQ